VENNLLLVELLLVLGVALGWGFWELYTLRRDKRRGEQNPPGDG
jgi:hypothetical protein